MWNNFLYGIWLSVPIIFFIQFSYNRITELRKKKHDPINRSNYYLQVGVFTLFCSVFAILVNEYFLITSIPTLIHTDYALETIQIVFYPLLVSFLAPYAGSNKPPETLQDHIQKHGLLKPFNSKNNENSRR